MEDTLSPDLILPQDTNCFHPCGGFHGEDEANFFDAKLLGSFQSQEADASPLSWQRQLCPKDVKTISHFAGKDFSLKQNRCLTNTSMFKNTNSHSTKTKSFVLMQS